MHLLQKNWIYLLTTLMICVHLSKQSVVLQTEGPQQDISTTLKPVNNSEVNHRKGRCECKTNVLFKIR